MVYEKYILSPFMLFNWTEVSKLNRKSCVKDIKRDNIKLSNLGGTAETKPFRPKKGEMVFYILYIYWKCRDDFNRLRFEKITKRTERGK